MSAYVLDRNEKPLDPCGEKTIPGLATGDLVIADVPGGRQRFRHVGRIAVHSAGSFNVTTQTRVAQGIYHRHCRILQRGDGSAVRHVPSPQTKERRVFLPVPKDRISDATIG